MWLIEFISKTLLWATKNNRDLKRNHYPKSYLDDESLDKAMPVAIKEGPKFESDLPAFVNSINALPDLDRNIIRNISATDLAVTVKLAADLKTLPCAIENSIARLEKAGLVKRVELDPKNKKLYVVGKIGISLSPSGRNARKILNLENNLENDLEE